MKDIQKPAFMQKAMQGNRGHIAIIEILIAAVVFGVSFIVMGIIQFPLMFMEMMSNQEYMNLLMRGDQESVQAAMDIAMDLPEWMMIVILLSEIFMILIVILYCRFLEKRKMDTMGFRKKGMVGQYALGMLGGFLFFSVAYLICVITGSIHFDGLSNQIAPLYLVGYLMGYMVQGMAEEVLCRGYLFVSLSKRYSVWYSVLLSAVFFAALHGMNPGLSVLAILNLVLFGVFAALLMVKYENIWIVGAFHSVWNFVQGNLYGIQVSGNSLQQSVFASTCKKNLSIMNGGAFGMEGGLAVTLVLAAGVAYLLWALNKDGMIVESNLRNPEMLQGGNVPPDGRMLQDGNVPLGGSGFQGGEMPSGGSVSRNGSGSLDGRASQGDEMLPDGRASRNGSGPLGDRVSQGDEMLPDGRVSWNGSGPLGNRVSMNENIRKRQPKRENMGVAPNETPWRPEQAVSNGTPQQNPNPFNADYFKD